MGIRNMEQRFLSVGIYALRNFEEIRFGKDNEKNTITEGIGGDVAIVRRSDKVGFVEIDVLASSSENANLAAVFALETPVPILYTDGSGNDIFAMAKAIPAKDPDASSSADSGAINTWRFIGKFDTYLVAGN